MLERVAVLQDLTGQELQLESAVSFLGQVRFPHVPPNGAAPARAWVWESILPLEARFEAMAGALCPVLGPGTKEMRMCRALY